MRTLKAALIVGFCISVGLAIGLFVWAVQWAWSRSEW